MASKISRVVYNLRWNMLCNQCAVIYSLLLVFSPSASQGKIKIDLFEIWNSAILRYNIFEEEKKKGGWEKTVLINIFSKCDVFDDVPINQTFLFLTFSPPFSSKHRRKIETYFCMKMRHRTHTHSRVATPNTCRRNQNANNFLRSSPNRIRTEP